MEGTRKAVVMMIEPKRVLKAMYWICILVAAMMLRAVGSAEAPAPVSAARQAKLAELTGQLRIERNTF